MYGKSERFEDYHRSAASGAVGFAFRLAGGAVKEVPASLHGQLLLIRAGAIRADVGDAAWINGPGCALLLGAQTQARVVAVCECVVYAALLPGGPWRAASASRVVAGDLVQALLGELVQAPAGASSARVRRIGELLRDELRLEDIPPIAFARPADPRLARACDAVLGDPSRPWDMQLLAREAGLSTRTLARRFVAQVGVAPGQWCRSVRLATALTEVARGGTLHAAAAVSGFAGPASLCAAFKQATGTTLRRYFRCPATGPEGSDAAFFG